MDDVSSLNLALPTAGTGAPDWVHLMPAGSFKGTTGEQTYHLKDTQAVITASMTAGKLPFDENHSTQRAPALGHPSPAHGWIVELQSREDGIWGKVEWNADGVSLMTKKSYRNVSPVFGFDVKGNVTRLISAALTNDPNLELTALHTAGETMDKIALCTALGIDPKVDDAAVKTLLEGGKTYVAALEAEVATLKRTTAPIGDMVTLQTRLQVLEGEQKEAKATAYVDAAIKAGKPIVATRTQFIAMHTADPAGTEKIIEGLPALNTWPRNPLTPPKPGDEGVAAMTAEQIEIVTAMGQDPKKYAERFKPGSEGSAV